MFTPILLGSSARSPNRGSELRTKVKTNRDKSHNEKCTVDCPKCSNPYNVGWGVFIPPTSLHHSWNAPPVPTKVKRLHQGFLVISLGWTVRLEYSYSDYMFLDLRWTFGDLRWWCSTGSVWRRLHRSPLLSRPLHPKVLVMTSESMTPSGRWNLRVP